MTYNKVQFIAYRVCTGPGQDPERYIGPSDEADDVRQRVRLMTEAVNRARPEVDHSPEVLKIFIAPEFYFRSMYGGYADLKFFAGEGAGRDPNSVVGGLANAVQGEQWKDWLFVFGTSVVVAGPFIPPDTTKDPNTAGKIEVLNIALVQKGGFANEDERTAKAVAIVKQYKSPVDWGDYPDVRYKNDQVAYFSAWPHSYKAELNSSGNTGGSIFKLDGITFGLEVCADHGMKRLRLAKPLAGDVYVQIQLVPSAGATISAQSVATLKGGLVCNVDGADGQTMSSPDDGHGYHSELFSVTSSDQPMLPSDLRAIAAKTTIDGNADLDEIKKVFWLPPDYLRWLPQLVIYEVANIPPPVKR